MNEYGVLFPFTNDGKGSVEYSQSLIDSLNSSLKQIILTKKGERVMSPDFGCDVWKVTFEYEIEIISALVDVYIREAVEKWENRLDIESIDISKDEEFIYAEITYSIRNTNLPLNSTVISF